MDFRLSPEEEGFRQEVENFVKQELPPGWDKDPKKLHERLVAERALDLSANAIETFKRVKSSWDAAPAR